MFENPYARLLLVPIGIGILMFGWLFLSVKCQRARTGPGYVRVEGRPPMDVSTAEGKLAYAQHIEYEKPAESVRITTEIADGPDASAAAKARAALPRRLHIQYSYAARSSWAEAEGALRELEKRFAGSEEHRKVREEWARDRLQAAQAAGKKGDFEAGERLFRECLKSAAGSAGWELIRAWREFLVARAKKAESSGNAAAAEKDWEEALSWHIEPRAQDEITREAARRGGPALFEKARSLRAAGRPEPAIGFAGAANLAFRMEGKGKEAEEAEAFLVSCVLDVARRFGKGPVETVPASAKEKFWECVSQNAGYRSPGRAEALEALVDLAAADGFAALSAGEFEKADSLFTRVMSFSVREWWMARAEADPAVDPFEGFPAELGPELAKLAGNSEDPQMRLECLRRLLSDGRWIPPHPAVARIRAALPDLYGRLGAKLIADRRFGEAEWRMRAAIRADRNGPGAQACVGALEDGIRKAAAAKDLASLVWLTGFLIAELGSPRAAFADDFRRAVTTAADGLTREPIRRIFMLSLLCDAFPDTREAYAARDEILARGLEFAKQAPEQKDDMELSAPTGTKDVAAASIENATGYFIFVFYEGPERFFVRLDPWRKGTALLRPGSYMVGVVATEASIRPYHTKRALGEKTYWAQYVVVNEGEKRRDLLGGSQATGDYRILRTLPGVTIGVDAKTGAAGAAK
ncbi:MAG: hypothetical protein IT452_00480 [Planctomycetia bacterium]|nr:hypothetical protein [Planctomycetia bacterium]